MKSHSSHQNSKDFEQEFDRAIQSLREMPLPATPPELHRIGMPICVRRQTNPAGRLLVAGIAAAGAVACIGRWWSFQTSIHPVDSVQAAEHHKGHGVVPFVGLPTKPPRESHAVATTHNVIRHDLDPKSRKPSLSGLSAVNELKYLNSGKEGVVVGVGSAFAKSAMKLPAMRDDFVAPPELTFASIGTPAELDEMAHDVMKNYKQEANVVDSRLVHNVSLAMKHASMSEVCKELQRQTGVRIAAGRNVRDDNGTLYVTSRPAREVLREISRVFGFMWEREGENGTYSYRLKQDTAAEIAEERLRNDDVAKAIQSLTRRVRIQAQSSQNLVDLCRQVFAELLPDEFDMLRSGVPVEIGTKTGRNKEQLDQSISSALLAEAGGIKPYKESFLQASRDDPDVIPFSKMKNSGVSVTLKMRISEFGGASLHASVDAYGSTDAFPKCRTNMQFTLGKVDGIAETPVSNTDKNLTLRSSPEMIRRVVVEPRPSTPEAEQRADSTLVPGPLGMSADYASYLSSAGLQPPHPFMTSDDFWQAVHEATGQDIIADSFSRLFKLSKYQGQLFLVLSQACDAMHMKWSVDEGWLVGRSSAYYWQRTNEVPMDRLRQWARLRLCLRNS